MLKKISSIVVALALVMTLIPATAFADTAKSTDGLTKTQHKSSAPAMTWEDLVKVDAPESEASENAMALLNSTKNLVKGVGDHDFEENESNDSSQLADWIEHDYTVTGRLSGKDVDYYAFGSDYDFEIDILIMASTSSLGVLLCDEYGNAIGKATDLGYDYSSDAYVYQLSASLDAGDYDLIFIERNQIGCIYLYYFESTGMWESDIWRIQGANRYETAFKTADELLYLYEKDQFDSVVVASGTNFPDALAGSYLACLEEAPILMTSGYDSDNNKLKTYIRDNLAPGGTIYVLGGKGAVPESAVSGLRGYNIQRLEGSNRYGTNMAILEAAGVGENDILVCTGEGFADSLSISSLGLPILLVGNKLSDEQKQFIRENEDSYFHIIGGPGAVSTTVENEMNRLNVDVDRIYGSNRYTTSIAVVDYFFTEPETMVMAYGQNFPDGLCGGPLAYIIDAPLILTATNATQAAIDSEYGLPVYYAYVLGGPSLISDRAVLDILLYESYNIMINLI